MKIKPIFIVLLVVVLLAKAPAAKAKDISEAYNNFSEARSAQIIDDRCHILKPDERSTIDKFVPGLINYITKNDDQAETKLHQIEESAQIKAPTSSCSDMTASVRNTYETRLANDLTTSGVLYVWAMDQGQRCKTISKDEYDTIYNQYMAYDKQIIAKYGQSVFRKYLVFLHLGESKSAQFACSDSRQLITTVMKSTTNLGKP